MLLHAQRLHTLGRIDHWEFGEKRLQVIRHHLPSLSIIELCNAVRLVVWVMQAVYCWLCTSYQSYQDKQDDEHNVMHSLTNFYGIPPLLEDSRCILEREGAERSTCRQLVREHPVI